MEPVIMDHYIVCDGAVVNMDKYDCHATLDLDWDRQL